jgi:hypothetical protein
MGAMLPGGLATFRRMRIAHLSDLHLTRGPIAGPRCVTHSVAVSHAAAARAF